MSDEKHFTLHPDIDIARQDADRLFEEMTGILRRQLPGCAEILHVGATAIPGCLTKGDLDIAVRVPVQCFSESDGALASLFTRNAGSIQTEVFSAFEDETRSPHLGIQLVTMNSSFDVFHLFTKALRNSPRLLEEYNALKREFEGMEMGAYRKAKDDFVTRVLSGKLNEECCLD